MLVGLKTGVVLEVECPDPGSVDSSVTYEIQPEGLVQRYEFKSIGYKIEVKIKNCKIFFILDAEIVLN